MIRLADARFNADGDRVYFQTGGGLEKQYRSSELDGGDERTHFNMKYANAVVPSPDGQWVAFTELFNAYIAPFPRTGNAFDLNKDTKAVPVTKVTRDAGTELHVFLGKIPGWKDGLIQPSGERAGPSRMKGVPVSLQAERRSKVVENRHQPHYRRCL